MSIAHESSLPSSVGSPSIFRDFATYVGRVSQFKPVDWVVYVVWMGMMFGLLISICTFLYIGHQAGVVYPAYVWNVPVGTAFFVLAIAIDTIGHRTVYKEVLARAEALIHHITIFSGVLSCVFLCICFDHPGFMRIPTLVLIALSIVYSLFDEAFHWHRYYTANSDRVEMWSHYFILFGHLIMILSWWHWFDEGYPGVAATLAAMK